MDPVSSFLFAPEFFAKLAQMNHLLPPEEPPLDDTPLRWLEWAQAELERLYPDPFRRRPLYELLAHEARKQFPNYDWQKFVRSLRDGERMTELEWHVWMQVHGYPPFPERPKHHTGGKKSTFPSAEYCRDKILKGIAETAPRYDPLQNNVAVTLGWKYDVLQYYLKKYRPSDPERWSWKVLVRDSKALYKWQRKIP